jgi:thiol-disulfide isomerase/thioredoxin
MTFLSAVPAAPAQSADQAFAELRAARNERPPPGDVATTSKFQIAQNDRVSRLAGEFYKKFPKDARRWEAIAWMVNLPRQFSGAGAETGRAAWEKQREELRDLLLESDQVSDAIWVGVAEGAIDDLDGYWGKPVRDLAKAGRIVAKLAARVPASDRRKFAEQPYVAALKKADPAAAEAFLRLRVPPAETNAAVLAMAAGELRIIEMTRTPLDLKFTAVDGREVDLAKLRGKVVLVDFWATWCVPCMAEMPNVRAAYKKYHDQGFEVVGISFDKAPGEKPRPMDKTAGQLNAFVREHDMPWPQHYDGKYWTNEFGARFAIREIPAAFLLGPDGRLVTTEARGEKLETEIRRLLEL